MSIRRMLRIWMRLLGGGIKDAARRNSGTAAGSKSHLGYREILGRIGRNFDHPKSQRRNHRQEKAARLFRYAMMKEWCGKRLKVVNTDEDLQKA